jgi:dipeptidyl aminopeptidase/acylaminoacyl peptidase
MRVSASIALMILLVAAPAWSQTPRPLVPADLFALEDIGEISVSPDGRSVVMTVTTTDVAANKSTTRTVVVPVSGGTPAPLAGMPADAGTLRWAPDGTRIAFIAPDGPGKSAIWTIPAAGGTPTRVCPYDRGNAFLSKAGNMLSWSPDGTRLAFAGTLELAPGPQDPYVATRLQYKTRTSLSDNRRSHIHVVAAAGGTPRVLTPGSRDEHSIDWGGDGADIVFVASPEADQDATLNYDIYAVNSDSGTIRQITRTPGVEMAPVVSPDGRTIAYLATTRTLTTIDSVAEDAHLFTVPFTGGAPRELNRALDRRTSGFAWTADSRALLFTAGDHGRTLIYRVATEGGASTPLFERNAQAGGISIARDGSLVFGLTDALAPREVFRMASTVAQPTRLTNLNGPTVAGWTLVTPETIRFKSADGTDVEGWYYPAAGGSGGRVPMLLSIHGGPHGSYGYAFNAAFQLNASHGYATLAINPRGSSGYGQAFADGCVNNWGGGDYQDLMAGVDYVIRTHSAVDPDRLGVMGGSYGGFMTNWVVTQTTRFKAAVSSASLSNLISFYATSLYQDLVHAEFSGFPWDGTNFDALWKWSPIAHVKDVTTPMLFMHGEQDNDVHITQAEEMYTALRRRAIEAALARSPREGHGFREPKHRLDSTVRTFAWMDRFLQPLPGSRE